MCEYVCKGVHVCFGMVRSFVRLLSFDDRCGLLQ